MHYLKYFYYLASNWNIFIAWHILWHEIKGEKKYQITTSAYDELEHLEDIDIDTSNATIYMPVSYNVLEHCFALAPVKNTHFLDVGCGMGRALCVAAHYGATQITGLDFSGKLCAIAKQNTAKTAQQFTQTKFTIIHNDAFYYQIPNAINYIFLFNPFNEFIMQKVAENITQSLVQNPRSITIVYVNPMHKNVFLNANFKQVNYFKTRKYLEAAILKNIV
jgi:16S rRNA G966 N2-methylase RsmD